MITIITITESGAFTRQVPVFKLDFAKRWVAAARNSEPTAEITIVNAAGEIIF